MTEPDLDLDEQLARLLRATRAATEPHPDARARVRSALALELASAGAVGSATRAGRGSKLWLLSALAVAVLVGFVLRGRLEKSPTVPAPPLSASAPLATAAEPAALPSPVSPELAPALPRTAASAAASAVVSAPAPAPAAPSASPVARASAKAREPADELALVSAMQLALRSGNAAEALALANEHARRFPNGALAQEREGARAIAQCQLAEPTARAAVQSAFEARYPSSPYVPRVKAACAR